MQQQPSALELLEALEVFLRDEVVAALEGGARFRALVAANAAGIVSRELRLGPDAREAECERLHELLGRPGSYRPGTGTDALLARMNCELIERIEAGEADAGPWRSRLIEHLRATTAAQLEIDNPKFRR